MLRNLCCVGAAAEEAAEDAEGLDHGPAQGPEPWHSLGCPSRGGDRPFSSCLRKLWQHICRCRRSPLFIEVVHYMRQTGVAERFPVSMAVSWLVRSPAVLLLKQLCAPPPPPMQVDPVFEGSSSGPGSLLKYNPLSNVSSAEVWNFLRVMVRSRCVRLCFIVEQSRASPAAICSECSRQAGRGSSLVVCAQQ